MVHIDFSSNLDGGGAPRPQPQLNDTEVLANFVAACKNAYHTDAFKTRREQLIDEAVKDLAVDDPAYIDKMGAAHKKAVAEFALSTDDNCFVRLVRASLRLTHSTTSIPCDS